MYGCSSLLFEHGTVTVVWQRYVYELGRAFCHLEWLRVHVGLHFCRCHGWLRNFLGSLNPQPFEGGEPDRHGLNLPFLFVIFQGDINNASHVRPDCFKLQKKEIQQLTLRLNSLELRITGNEEGSLGLPRNETQISKFQDLKVTNSIKGLLIKAVDEVCVWVAKELYIYIYNGVHSTYSKQSQHQTSATFFFSICQCSLFSWSTCFIGTGRANRPGIRPWCPPGARQKPRTSGAFGGCWVW